MSAETQQRQGRARHRRHPRHRPRHRARARRRRLDAGAVRRQGRRRRRAASSTTFDGRADVLPGRRRQRGGSRAAGRGDRRTLRRGQRAREQRRPRAARARRHPRRERGELRRADADQPAGSVLPDPGARAPDGGAQDRRSLVRRRHRLRHVGVGGDGVDRARRVLRQQGRPGDGGAAVRRAARAARHSRLRSPARHHRHRHDRRASARSTTRGSPTAWCPSGDGVSPKTSAAPSPRWCAATCPTPPARSSTSTAG